jgi:hypothetical protein
MSRNPATCPHSIVEYDPDTYEYYCRDCGEVVGTPENAADYFDSVQEDRGIQDGI